MPDLSGKVFVVTGGNGGIGLRMADGIAEAGGAVAIWARNEEKNTNAVRALQDIGGEAKSYICDVSNEEEVIRALASTVKDFGRVDGLFANAGRGGGRAARRASGRWHASTRAACRRAARPPPASATSAATTEVRMRFVVGGAPAHEFTARASDADAATGGFGASTSAAMRRSCDGAE